MKKKGVLLILFVVVFISCNNEYTPKPKGYQRIERHVSMDKKFDMPLFSFSYPNDINIAEERIVNEREYWFNILYPEYNVTLYCSYLPVTKETLPSVIEDSYRFAFGHSSMAEGISQTVFSDSLTHNSGIIYDIQGTVAVPLQFYITDNKTNILRGSAYFDKAVNRDSVAPVVPFIKEDVLRLMETLEWKKE